MQVTTNARNPSSDSVIQTAPRSNAKVKKVLFGAALGLIPIAIGGAVGLLARSKRAGLIAGGASAVLLGVSRWQLERTFNDEPDYEVLERFGKLEIREYRPHVEAQTEIAGVNIVEAIEAGFDRLAEYIFGNNDKHEKLGMTTPVAVSKSSNLTGVSFVMPIGRTAASLPLPADARIEVVEVPPRRVAVLSFHGKRDQALIDRKMAELRRLVSAAGLESMGEPTYAGFDPPWTLPMIRRNEVWIQIAPIATRGVKA